MATVPVSAVAMRRRRAGLCIDTDTRSFGGLSSGDATVTNYVSTKRSQRLRRGTWSQAACMVLIMGSLWVLRCVEVYSHAYYLAYAVAFGSFALMLPAALPTDNTKVKRVLYFTALCACGVLTLALTFARRRWIALRTSRCQKAYGLPFWYCCWNVFFWIAVVPPSVWLCVTLVRAAREMPIEGLNRFWFASGVYLVMLGAHNCADTVVAYRAGLFLRTGFTKIVWRLVLTVEIVTLGLLCCSNQFKLRTWKFMARLASIKTVATVTATTTATTTFSSSCVVVEDYPEDPRDRRRRRRRRGGGPLLLQPRRRRSVSPPS